MFDHRPRNLILATSTFSSSIQVAPPALRDAGDSFKPLSLSRRQVLRNMVRKLAAVPLHRQERLVFLVCTSHDNQLIVSPCLISVNCWEPICLEFLGLATLITAKGPAKDHELGRETSPVLNEHSSPGRRRPKKPTITRVEKQSHASRLLASSVIIAKQRASQTMAQSKGIGKGAL